MEARINYTPKYIRIYSDLHMEMQGQFTVPHESNDCDTLLILAGDIDTFMALNYIESKYINFLKDISERFPYSIIVPRGNRTQSKQRYCY